MLGERPTGNRNPVKPTTRPPAHRWLRAEIAVDLPIAIWSRSALRRRPSASGASASSGCSNRDRAALNEVVGRGHSRIADEPNEQAAAGADKQADSCLFATLWPPHGGYLLLAMAGLRAIGMPSRINDNITCQ